MPMRNNHTALVSREPKLHLNICLGMLKGMLKCLDAYENNQEALISRELDLHLRICLSMLKSMLKCLDASENQSESMNVKKARPAFTHLLGHAQRHAQMFGCL